MALNSDANEPLRSSSREVRLQAAEGQTHTPGHKCGALVFLVSVLGNVLLIAVLLLVAPLLFLIFATLTLPSVLEWFCCRRRRQYLDAVSASQLQMAEGAAIHGVFILKQRMSADTFFNNWQRVYLSEGSRPEFKRLKQRTLRRSWFWPYWEDVEHGTLDWGYHMNRKTEEIDKDGLQSFLGGLESVVMDFEKPLWQLFFFECYVGEDGVQRSVVIQKGHHCMHDGFTALRLVLQGADPRAPPENAQQSRSRGSAGRGRQASCCATVVNGWCALRQLLLMRTDPTSLVKSQVHAKPEDVKSCAWHTLSTIGVQDLKDFGRTENGGGATVNDLLLTALGGALRRYFREASAAVTAAPPVPDEITACIWVSRAPIAHIYKDFDELPLKWGNSTLGACYIKIPLHEPQSDGSQLPASLADMKSRTSAPELMIQALLATKLLGFFGVGPRVLMRPLWRMMCNKISVSTSNVPGPSFDMAWCDAPVDQMVFFVPPQGTISVFLTVITYAGKVTVGMGADGALISPQVLKKITSEFFEAELMSMIEY